MGNSIFITGLIVLGTGFTLMVICYIIFRIITNNKFKTLFNKIKKKIIKIKINKALKVLEKYQDDMFELDIKGVKNVK